MTIELVPVMRDEKEILRNLMEKYDYEMSQYGGDDVNKLGLYGFDYFDNYWQEGAERWAFFIKADGKLAGFAMFISDHFYLKNKKADYMMNDFFVMYKYRKAGVGKFAATELFDKFKGKWQLNTLKTNAASVAFWTKVINRYTNGEYEIFPNEELGADYHQVFYFSSAEPPEDCEL